MRIVVLYKTFDGEEWIEASLESIYPMVDRIVMVHSEVDWLKEKHGNQVRPVVQRWQRTHDRTGKVTHLNYTTAEQSLQYRHGLDWIAKNLPGHVVMFADADEVWTKEAFERSLAWISKTPKGNAFHCRMHTYVRSPLFRVAPPEPCMPLVFLRRPDSFAGVRGNRTRGRVEMPDVFMHHFTMVRMDEQGIMTKIARSSRGDGTPSLPARKWFQEKFLKLPHVTNFHHSQGHEHCWQHCEVIPANELPECVLNKPVAARYLPKS